jgi:hypothetical protein
MPREPREAKPMEAPTPEEAQQPGGEQITYEEMIEEFREMLGEKDQQLAGLRIITKRQAKTIEGLQEELTKKGS